ncbi:MAG: glycosyltransferase [Acidobacteria bacterium]|nr:glycosyltransferase [Acidobacteriota bacterium]
MKLLYLCPEYPPAPCGGVGVFYQTLATEAARRGLSVSVLSADPAGREPYHRKEAGVDVLRIPASGREIPDRLRFRREAGLAVERLRPDLVETYDWSGPVPGRIAAPLVVRMHGASTVRAGWFGRRPSRLLAWCERQTLRSADALAAVSDWIGRHTASTFPLGQAWTTLPNGVDADLFRPDSSVWTDQESPRRPEALYVGSVREDKGAPLLLDAFAVVARRRPDLHLRMTGALPPQGLAAPFLADRLAGLEPGVRRRIRFDGRQQRASLPSLYQQAAFCVFPSSGEAHPMACLEAMACGAPVIANAAGGMGETIAHERSGWLVQSRDPSVWAAAMERALASPEQCRLLGQAARRRVESCYRLDRMVDRNLQFYALVAAGRAVAA